MIRNLVSQVGNPRSAMVLILASLCAAMLYGLSISIPAQTMDQPWVTVTHSDPDAHHDLQLYQAIAERVALGEPYYATAIAEQRARSYPVRPFLTVRLPTLAKIRALVGTSETVSTMLGLSFFLLISLSWWVKMRPFSHTDQVTKETPIGVAIVSMIPLISGLTIYIGDTFLFMHEVWAGGLIAIGIALYRPGRPWLTMIAVALALAVRETSLPMVLLFTAFAVFHKRWQEAVCWAAMSVAFGIGLAWHADTVAKLTNPNDMASLGWNGLGGWATYLTFVHDTTILRFFPLALTALLVPLSLIGWIGAKHLDGKLIFLFQSGYAIIIMLMARADNYYWAFIVAPTLLMGLAFLPQLFADLRERWTEGSVSG